MLVLPVRSIVRSEISDGQLFSFDVCALYTFHCAICISMLGKIVYVHVLVPSPVAQSVECLLRGTGGHRVDPGPRHTNIVKNGTSCSSLGTQTY